MHNFKIKLVSYKVSDEKDVSFKCSADVATSKWVRDLFEIDSDKEKFYVILCNIKNKIIGYSLISMGSMTASIVHPREVLKAAILASAASIIFVHNHPSGDPEPSLDDIEITNRLSKACSIMGIMVLDHIILGEKEKFFSFKMKNML